MDVAEVVAGSPEIQGSGASAQEVLTGWGRTAPTRATVLDASTGLGAEPAAVVEPRAESRMVSDLLAHPSQPPVSVIARGLGRSYGDAAQNAGGVVLRLPADPVPEPGPMIDVPAGVSLDDLLRRSVPAGYFVAVTPGTRFVTHGGALASDIHGKNHHSAGSFSQHVEEFTLVLPDGQSRVVRPGEELFEATAGGMGLTGIVTSMRVRMQPIETARMVVLEQRHPDLDASMAALRAMDAAYPYSVAWIDTLARGAALGRSVVGGGRHATLADVAGTRAERNPLDYDPQVRLNAPVVAPNFALNRFTVAAFNEAWYRKAPKRGEEHLQSIPGFFHPLDAVGGWNKVYGNRGFLQYQFVVPDDRDDVVTSILVALSERRVPVFLAVLKRFGAASSGMLSFPIPGWTLAVDIPADVPGLSSLLDGFDEQVAAAGGRIYLAKDSRVRPEVLEQMYPRLEEFRAVRDQIDPQRHLRSDMSVRLGL